MHIYVCVCETSLVLCNVYSYFFSNKDKNAENLGVNFGKLPSKKINNNLSKSYHPYFLDLCAIFTTPQESDLKIW